MSELDERLTTAKGSNDESSDKSTALSLVGGTTFLPDPEPAGSTRPLPLTLSEAPESPGGRAELLAGALMLGFSETDLLDHQFTIADMMSAVGEDGRPLHRTNALAIPRRGFKTTTVWCLAVGRCLNPDRKPVRGGYEVVFTAQSGNDASTRFRDDLLAPLEALYDLDDPACPVKVSRGKGSEQVVFKETGARIRVVPPIPARWRGASVDLAIISEAQEVTPEESAPLLAAIVPTMGTRRNAQLLVEGTAKDRVGLFWDQIVKGRDGHGGIVEYGLSEFTPDPDPEHPEEVEGTTGDPMLWVQAHPGIPVTPLDFVADQYRDLPLERFKNEYLGIFSTDSSSRFLSPDKWDNCLVQTEPPSVSDFTRWAVTFAIHPDNLYSSVAFAARDAEGRGHIGTLESKAGVEWVVPFLVEFAAKYPKAPIYFSKKLESNRNVRDDLARVIKPARLQDVSQNDVSQAGLLFVKDLNRQALRHYDDARLNAAVENVTKKTYPDGRWYFSKSSFVHDITAVEATSLALLMADRTAEPRQRRRMVVIPA